MGLMSFLGLKPPKTLPPVSVTARPIWEYYRDEINSMTPAALWKKQPYLRTVVTFIARSIAAISIHVLERDEMNGRERVRHTPLANVMTRPNSSETMYEFLYAAICEFCIYDECYIAALPLGYDDSAQWTLKRIPQSWVVEKVVDELDPFEPVEYIIQPPNGGEVLAVPGKNMLHFHGFNPDSPLEGYSPVESLRQILLEQTHAQIFRNQIWTNGGRVNSYITRPANTPWDDKHKKKFVESFRAAYTGANASRPGGIPLLEDGMKIESLGFSAREEEFIEAAKLALSTVAAVYHVNPTMVGLLDNANYSNVREFRRMLYGDTLAPIIKMLEEKFNGFLVPLIEPDNSNVYVEFNLAEKMRGSFEEQAAVLQSAVGRPYMNVNEARAMQNLPWIDGGDELLYPLNMAESTNLGKELQEQNEEQKLYPVRAKTN